MARNCDIALLAGGGCNLMNFIYVLLHNWQYATEIFGRGPTFLVFSGYTVHQ